ncbi:uncharacterized protein LOC107271044 isoform X2 [Cephus cinctus]|uniref:TBC1 domain family member 30 n=1 Tax=Cephus cinctus TaxID=211228 RepID=A0AAJ7W4T9_CEPCN|nr:uncharacterized protein LOC107271044 isoform X2 [Cephus cinctus]
MNPNKNTQISSTSQWIQNSMGHPDVSYRVKCVNVESERVFRDISITQQSSNRTQNVDVCENLFPTARKRSMRNLIRQTFDTPDFMELNKKPIRRVDKNDQVNSDIVIDKGFRSKYENRNLPVVNSSNKLGEDTRILRGYKEYPQPLVKTTKNNEVMIISLVDQLLMDIYGLHGSEKGRSGSESTASSFTAKPCHPHLQRARLLLKHETELRILVRILQGHVNHAGGLLIRQLRRRDYLLAKRDKLYDVITAHLQARSEKRNEDTRMKFSVVPQPGESGFTQWLDAMKMVGRLPGGIPPEFRKRLWLILAERHLEQRGVDWRQAEKVCFNEWSNPDDEELGIQIVKDLHRTGCSLFCGAAGRDNQAVLRRVLLGFARWNKSVGYCQGLNVLAALVLQVMDRAESSAVKVMIYLIEGVLPEGYFADNLRGLSVDMAVFRDLLRMRLPKLSRHLEALQSDAKDKATGSSYEPPLTNVFTMQWFLTLFCHCLPQEAVLRVWDLIFLEGDEVLLRTALAIWEGLADRIMTVTSADEFYSIMGVLTREMLEFTDTNNLVKAIVSTGPLSGLTNLREKHRYNITPWARRLSDDDETDTEEEERLAVAAAMFGLQRSKKDRASSSIGPLQAVVSSGGDRERLALDISTLKQQYAKLRERQRQAHIILSAACARQSMVSASTSQAMNHLLVGKSALVSGKNRQLGPPPGAIPPKPKHMSTLNSPRSQNRKDKQGVTLHWKDTKKRKESKDEPPDVAEAITSLAVSPEEMHVSVLSPKRGSIDSDSDSTSTELCDEPDKLSDVDSEEPTSTSDCYVMATDDEKSPRAGNSPGSTNPLPRYLTEDKSTAKIFEELKVEKDTKFPGSEDHADGSSEIKGNSVAEIIDRIRELSVDNEANASSSHGNNESKNDVTVHDFRMDEEFKCDSEKPKEAAMNITSFTARDSESQTKNRAVNKKSGILDKYEFLNVTDSMNVPNVGATIEDSKVPLSGAFITVKEESVASDIRDKDSFTVDVGSFGDRNSDRFDGARNIEYDKSSETFFEIANPLANSDFDKKLVSNLQVQRFDSLLDYNSSTVESKDSSTVDSSVMDKLDSVSIKLPLYSKSYVVGHLPISPITVDQKFNKLKEVVQPADDFVLTNIREELSINVLEGSSTFDTRKDSTSFVTNSKISNPSGKPYYDGKHSPKTPESGKSYSSGETMGPDSKTSSLAASPRTPHKSESREFHVEKSGCSSVSSESKTLTHHSIESDDTSIRVRLEPKKGSLEKSSPSTPMSSDSLKNKSEVSSKFIVSSSSDSCSPERKKSSERSFSSELQSPISANSIKYTTSYKGAQDNLSDSSIDLCSATSPFYPIAHPNQKTPSPYSVSKQKSSTESTETSPEQKSTGSKDSVKLSKHRSGEKGIESSMPGGDAERIFKENNDYLRTGEGSMCKEDFDSVLLSSRLKLKSDKSVDSTFDQEHSESYNRKRRKFGDEESELLDRFPEKDTVSPLPRDTSSIRSLFGDKGRGRSFPEGSRSDREYSYGGKEYLKSFERSSSSLDKRFADLKLSASANEFDTNVAKKRCSDILEDLRHLEAKNSADGTGETGLLTKKTSYIMEDLKSLEARRQDTFSDSASGLSKGRLADLSVNIIDDARKSYVVQPKIHIDESSDSILQSLTRSKGANEIDDDRESKLGVWTKVKPRKKSDNGRRSSDRALKIIQENSAILHKILTCQAKKRLPDLEEISKEITISPINEEISKIFSPILEKIGLNEDEINEELARINFKDFDQMTVTSGSEFDAKINDELSKLSLIDDTEEIDHLVVDEILSRDYLDTREALIDRQINEELSKLLANYEECSSATISCREKGSSSQNASEVEGLDLSSISTNVFSHKSSDDSIETRSELGSVQEINVKADKFYQYTENVLPYTPTKYNLRDISSKSDIDIYQELEKLDKISSAQIVPTASTVISPKALSPPFSTDCPSYADVKSSALDYSVRSEKPFDSSSLKSPYDSYKPYDFKSRISPRKTPSNPYSVRSYEKSAFEITDQKPISSSRNYDLPSTRSILSKETLEFRVRYDDEPSQQVHEDDLTLRPYQTDLVELDKGASYYENKPITPTSYIPKEELLIDSGIPMKMEYEKYIYDKLDSIPRSHETITSKELFYAKTPEFERQPYMFPLTEHATDYGNLNVRRRESHSLSPNHQFADRKLTLPMDPRISTLSPSLEDVTKRPVSHPEFPDKLSLSKFTDLPSEEPSSSRKSSLSLGNIGHVSRIPTQAYDTSPSMKTQFSPFPVSRNTVRKPKELGLKLGLYSPTSSGVGPLKRS